MTEMENKTGGLVRAQSSLELLSQTAALKNVLDESSKDQATGISTVAPLENMKQQSAGDLTEASKIAEQHHQQQLSPFPARITPAESATCLLLDKARACSSLSLPEMAGGSVYLEQKRSFLPSPFEGRTTGDLENSPTYGPGLFLSYSNVSTGTTTGAQSNRENSETTAVAGPPAANSSGSDGSDNPSLGLGSSFSSANGSTSSSFIPALNLNGISSMAAAPGNMRMPTAFVAPRPQQLLHVQRVSSGQFSDAADEQQVGRTETKQLGDMAHENSLLRQQLVAKDATIEALQKQVAILQKEVGQLRQLPTGKISQIPIEEMLTLMREFGSEVSDTSMPPRKTYVQRASVVRQFRRWNPNFLKYFEFKEGRWHPKLGREGELKRRQESRRLATTAKRNKQRHD